MRDPLHILWRKAEGRASMTTACTRSSPASSAAADLDDMDERVRAASFTLLGPHPHTLMVRTRLSSVSCRRTRKTALNCIHAQNGRLIGVLIDRRWGREACAVLSRARRVRVKAAHRVVTLARSPAPVHSVDVSSEDALREMCEALIRHQRLRRNVPTATC